jgi:hypothetical protein
MFIPPNVGLMHVKLDLLKEKGKKEKRKRNVR